MKFFFQANSSVRFQCISVVHFRKNSDAMAITVAEYVMQFRILSSSHSGPYGCVSFFAEQPSDTAKYVPPNDFKKNHAADLPFLL